MLATDSLPVEVTYDRPGTTPPIFVAGSFTDPAWDAVELEYQQSDGQFKFFRTFDIKPGTHQYKLRLGHGDWWICDDTRETERDSNGNVNNVLLVEPNQIAAAAKVLAEPLCDLKSAVDNVATTSSVHTRRPSFGADGADDLVPDNIRSLTEKVAPVEDGSAIFHGANGNIEQANSVPKAKVPQNSEDEQSFTVNGNAFLSYDKQASPVGVCPGDGGQDAGNSSASKSTKNANQLDTSSPKQKRGEKDERLSRTPSMPAVNAEPAEQKRQEFWLTRFCRAVFQGIFDTIPTMLCGKRRKLVAVVFTAVMIPFIAWKLQAR